LPTVRGWLEDVRRALREEGFAPTEFQHVKSGQYFGLVKDLPGGLQMHVRGFSDGRLEAEIEVSRFYLEHPLHKRPAARELARILKKHGIPYAEESILRFPLPVGRMPKSRTDWRRSLLHPILYRILAVYSICLGGLLLFLFAATEGWHRAVLFLGGGLLILVGAGILLVVKLIEKALRPPPS
jgi:hypothetical protein